MKKVMLQMVGVVLSVLCLSTAVSAQDEVYPVAILNFSERGEGMKDQAANVRDILFAKLIINDKLILVERAELDKILSEAELNLSGSVAQEQATQIGKLTGAKILITGSVFKVSNKTYIVAKIIGTETGRVLGKSVEGSDDISTLTSQLAEMVGTAIVDAGNDLMPKSNSQESVIARIQQGLKGKTIPTVYVSIDEQHIGKPASDPAAETELIYILKTLGTEVVDKTAGDIATAEYKIVGEGFSEFATRTGNLVSVKARLEVKVLDKAGKIVAVDRQTTVKVDLNEMLAGKTALQEAAASIAERIIPKLAK